MQKTGNKHFLLVFFLTPLLQAIVISLATVGESAANRFADLNIYQLPLQTCSIKPMTGFFRNGNCSTSTQDTGSHTVCVEATLSFLEFSKRTGNDLSTPHPPYFEGVKPGENWCVCALRWKEALDNGYAPPVLLASTHYKALDYVKLEDLEKYDYLSCKDHMCKA